MKIYEVYEYYFYHLDTLGFFSTRERAEAAAEENRKKERSSRSEYISTLIQEHTLDSYKAE